MINKILILVFIIFILTSCMKLEDVNAGLWYSARKVNNTYMDLLKNKCDMNKEAELHMEYLSGDPEEFFTNKYEDRIFADSKSCSDSIERLSCDDLKKMLATDIESSTNSCITIFEDSNLDACISFNYFFTEVVISKCEERGEEIKSKHMNAWPDTGFYCPGKYNNSFIENESFPPREVCMLKILNLNCDELENYAGSNIEDKLECYIDGHKN